MLLQHKGFNLTVFGFHA